MNSNSKSVIGVLIAATILSSLGGGIYLYNRHLNEKKLQAMNSEGISVEVERVRRSSLSRIIKVVGNLQASNTVVVRSQVRGQISNVIAQGGQEVEKNALLFEIDDRSFKAALKEAQAKLSFAQEAFKRSETLASKNFASTKTLDEARASLLTAEAGVERAQKDVDDTRITAPYEGIVSIHNISIGATVGPDVELTTITDIDPIKIEFKVPAQYFSFISINQLVEFNIESLPDQKFTASIEAIDPKVDPATQQVTVRATLDNPKRILKPGLFAQVSVSVGSKDSTLVIPEESVESTPDQSYAYKVIEHPEHPGVYVVFRVPIRTGIEEGDRVEVTQGLNEGDIVLTVGQNKVKDGYPVKFDMATITDAPEEKTKTDEKSAASTEGKTLKQIATDNPVSRFMKGFFGSKKEPVKAPEAKKEEVKEETKAAEPVKEEPKPSEPAKTEASEEPKVETAPEVKEDVKSEVKEEAQPSEPAKEESAPAVAEEPKAEASSEVKEEPKPEAQEEPKPAEPAKEEPKAEETTKETPQAAAPEAPKEQSVPEQKE